MKWFAGWVFGLGAPLRTGRVGVMVSVLLWPWLPIARMMVGALMGQLD